MLSDLLKEFTFELEIKNYSKQTIETYQYNTTQFLTYLKEQHDIVEDIEDVAPVHVKKFIQHQLNLGFKATYVNTLIKSLRAFFKYLEAEEYVHKSIMTKVKLLREDKEVIQTFTAEEVTRMIEAYSFKNYLNARNKVILVRQITLRTRYWSMVITF